MRRLVSVWVLMFGLCVAGSDQASATGAWAWPVTGPILRQFDPPDSPYGAGHRGVDIGAAVRTAIRAPAAGVVSFAGKVGGQLFLTIAHGGGVQSTDSWLTDVLVRKGDAVVRGQVVAHTGWGHVADPSPHLHFSVRVAGVYVDPLDYLSPMDVGALIRLAPLAASSGGTTAAPTPSRAVWSRTFRMGRPWTPLVLPIETAVVAIAPPHGPSRSPPG